jgi:predicted nucleic acid-binding protein
MITAVDTNILLDILIPDAPQGEMSEKSLTESLASGAVIISEIVYTELAAHFSMRAQIDLFLEETGINLYSSSADALYLAGRTWREYLRRRTITSVCLSCGTTHELRCLECGAAFISRQHVVADFIIGAHAVTHADRLLTRDRGYYGAYYPDLQLTKFQKQ